MSLPAPVKEATLRALLTLSWGPSGGHAGWSQERDRALASAGALLGSAIPDFSRGGKDWRKWRDVALQTFARFACARACERTHAKKVFFDLGFWASVYTNKRCILDFHLFFFCKFSVYTNLWARACFSFFLTGAPGGNGCRQRQAPLSPSPRPPGGLQDLLGRASPGTGPSGSLWMLLEAFLGLLGTSGELQEGPEKA